jgi:hypothetical protein
MTDRSDVLLNLCSWTSERLCAARSYLSVAALLILFALVITPVALVFRAVGRDLLRLRKTAPDSYWIPCAPTLRGRTEMMRPF